MVKKKNYIKKFKSRKKEIKLISPSTNTRFKKYKRIKIFQEKKEKGR